MAQVRSSGGGRGVPIEDPAQIRTALETLHREETEFPVKVEGTHTLPYTSRLHQLEAPGGHMLLKLIRPLPHELLAGAPFEMMFAVGDQRLEAPITFLGRDAYLLYRFTQPVKMTPSDRRRHKRYPFRPREKAYVMVQDGGASPHGMAGPLVNLSLGGLAFRVDRIMRLEDHLRVTPGLGFFDKGKDLPMLKIRDLPKHPLFEARGMVANAWERGSEIIVGIQFGSLKEAEQRQLQEVLQIREQMQKASSPAGASAPPREGRKSKEPAEPQGPARRIQPAGTQTPDALIRLGRRSTFVVVAMEPGPDRDEACASLRRAGYLRLETTPSLPVALECLRAEPAAGSRLLVHAPGGAFAPSLPAVLSYQRDLGELHELSVALLRRHPHPEDEALPEAALIRAIPWPQGEGASWLPALDDLVGLG